jgi:hypothetical protein
MAELLPCPFCGGFVCITEKRRLAYGNRADYEATIECACGLIFEREWTVEVKSNEEVLLFGTDIETAWNTYTPKERGGEK